MTTNAYAVITQSAVGRQPGDRGDRIEPGALLQGSYRIVERIAIGGMGEVYVATHERLAGRYAVKALLRELVHNEDALARFRREAQIMSGLHHPHVAEVFDFNVSADGTPYLVMELLEGKSLQTLIDDEEPLPKAQVAAVVKQVASALAAAHAQGVVHRDLKPDNVIVLPLEDGVFVKVIDFGISKVAATHRLTAERSLLGTPEYMSPEQAQGRCDSVDHRSDQFALAALAYALLSGRPPFVADDPMAVLFQVVNQQAAPLTNHVSWAAHAVDAVIQRGLSKNPDDRFPDILKFARALEQAIGTRSETAVARVPGPVPLVVLKTPSSASLAVAASKAAASVSVAPRASTAVMDPDPVTVRMREPAVMKVPESRRPAPPPLPGAPWPMRRPTPPDWALIPGRPRPMRRRPSYRRRVMGPPRRSGWTVAALATAIMLAAGASLGFVVSSGGTEPARLRATEVWREARMQLPAFGFEATVARP